MAPAPAPAPSPIPPEPFTPHWEVLESQTRRTDFIGSGMQMVQEYRQGQETQHQVQQYQQICHTYVYARESYAPIARLSHEGRYESVQGGINHSIIKKTAQRWRYYHTDVNGAPCYITNQEGELVWRDDITLNGPYRMRQEGFNALPIHQQVDWRQMETLRYQGQYRDQESGLHYNTFRYFDPSLGRFSQPDPIGLAGGWNLYQYAPNPFGWVDPWGWLTFPADHKDLFPTTGSQRNIVEVTMQGSRTRDFTAAYKEVGISKSQANGYTWHHVDDFDPNTGKTTMQLVKTDGEHRQHIKALYHSLRSILK